jgi:four helix bundle protein
MATIQKFEDLICWQRGRELTKEIYKTFSNCRDYGFRDQIQRAAVSVASNIAEGFERGTKQEFLNYLYIAKGSAGEVRTQLYIAFDIGYLNIEKFKYLNNLAQDCSRLAQSFAEKVKGGSKAGTQFRKAQTGPDFTLELLKQQNPEIYNKYYAKKNFNS